MIHHLLFIIIPILITFIFYFFVNILLKKKKRYIEKYGIYCGRYNLDNNTAEKYCRNDQECIWNPYTSQQGVAAGWCGQNPSPALSQNAYTIPFDVPNTTKVSTNNDKNNAWMAELSSIYGDVSSNYDKILNSPYVPQEMKDALIYMMSKHPSNNLSEEEN